MSGLVMGAVPLRAPHFVSRAQVSELSEVLARERVAVVVCGMRGAGKTQVAAAYAHQIRTDPDTGLVGWIGAETRDSTLAGLTEIATALRVADPAGDSRVSAQRLRNHLNSNQELSGVLVFDNALDPDFLTEFLPTSGGVRVVITSTDRAFTRLGTLVDAATGFDRTESIEYLHNATTLDDPAGADRLADQVGDLPLALAAAAATIHARRLDYRAYLDMLAAQPLPTVMPRQRGGGHPLAVDQALGLAIDTAATSGDPVLDGRVRWLVGVIAMLSPDGVEADLLEHDPNPVTGAAIARCVEGSLLSWSTDGRVLAMHRLTARLIRERAIATGSLEALTADAVAVLEPRLFNEQEAFQRRSEGARLVEHIDTLTEHTIALDPDTQSSVLAACRWATRQLTQASDLQRAIPHAEHTHTTHHRILGEDHPATLTTRNQLAYSYREAGRIAEAIALFERTLADRVRVLGGDHPDTLTSRNNLARAYRGAGQIPEAIALFEQLLTDRTRILGSDHPDTLTTRHNLARAYQEAGRVAEAIELFERTLTDRVRVLGGEHPDTLSTRDRLAYSYESAGRIAEAIPLYERTLTDRVLVLGEDHPDTLTSRDNLALAYESEGRVAEAIPLYERTLTDAERVLDAGHPRVAIYRDNLVSARERLRP